MSPKLGYCLSDSALIETRGLSPPEDVYGGDRCVNPTRIIGISAGWGDVYRWWEPGQSIDISDVPDGFYWFRSTVDPDNYLIESDKTDHLAMHKGSALRKLRGPAGARATPGSPGRRRGKGA